MLTNGICDPVCQQAEDCGFDADDCAGGGCKPSTIKDGICNEECYTLQDQWDGGDCGHCYPTCETPAPTESCNLLCGINLCYNSDLCKKVLCSRGCFEEMVGDGICHPECDNLFCLYDGGDCDHCAPDCTKEMMKDGNCDLVCATKFCGSDLGDCTGQSCAPGCDYESLGDFHCDESCNVSECNFDNGDCNPGASCLTKAKNGVCDPECNNYIGRYDSGDCGSCYPSCDPKLINNFQCDSTCQHLFCMADRNACETSTCAPNCSSLKVGNGICETECTVKECQWDGGDCGYCAPGCENAFLADGVCQPECRNQECGFDLGDCDSEACAPGCTYAQVRNYSCEPACVTAECFWDLSACASTVCSLGCTFSLLKNSKCDMKCWNEGCHWDAGACDTTLCSPNCNYGMLRNSKCDITCQNKACGWDSTDCGTCAAGCEKSKLSDGICQLECRVSECNFDLPDCKAIECAPGCTFEMLDNGTCDELCLNQQCGWDGPDCEICRQYCALSNLNNGECDKSCAWPECGFDVLDCAAEECSPGCSYSRLGDHTCDLSCQTQACFYDYGDCGVCYPGCLISMIGDGVCQPECRFPTCNFDLPDCSGQECAAGCKYHMMLNMDCDPACNVRACGFDNYRCDCDTSCTYAMMNNKQCDPSCANLGCGYDGDDCSCNNGLCKFSDRGKCKKDCLVLTCSFDAYFEPTFPLRCTDQVKFRLAYAYMALTKKWDAVYDFEEVCRKPHPECTFELITNGYAKKTCPVECNREVCMYALGLCNLDRPLNCLSSRNSAEGNCLYCDNAISFSLYSFCPVACPRYYKENVQYHICQPLTDQATDPDHPDVMYVATPELAKTSENKGTRNDPYTMLSLAFAGTWQSYTIIYLLKGAHKLTAVPRSEPDGMLVNDLSDPFVDFPGGKVLQVRTLFCSEDPHPLCATTPATIQYTAEPFTLTTYHTMEFFDLIIDGSQILTKDGVVYSRCSDGTPVDQDHCSHYYKTSFFRLLQGSELLFKVTYKQNVEVMNIRNQPYSFIESKGGSITLENVRFFNLEMGRTGLSGVITLVTCPGQNKCGSFSFVGGTVTRINDVGNFDPEMFLSSFFYADGFENVRFENVEFSYNNVLAGRTEDTTTYYGLVCLEIFTTLVLKNCQFHHNIAKEGVLLFNFRRASLLRADRNKLHVSLTDVTISQNYGERSVMHFRMSADLLNVELARLVFSQNVCQSGSVLSVEYTETMDDSLKYGGMSDVTNEWYKPRYADLTTLTFRDNVAAQGSFFLSNLANVRVEDVQLFGNTDALDDPMKSLVLADFLTVQPPMQLTTAAFGFVMSACQYVAGVRGSFNYKLSRIDFHSNKCAGYAGLYLKGPVLPAVLDSIVLKDSSGGLGIMYVSVAEDTAFTKLTIQNTVCNDNIIYLGDHSKVTFLDSAILDNQSTSGGLYASLSASLTVKNSQFLRNKSVYGAAVYFVPGRVDTMLTVIQSTFSNNEATEDGGAIYVSQSATGVSLLQVTECTFSFNSAGHNGAAFYVASSAKIDPYSSISKCTVASNKVVSNGAFFFQYKSGTLSISDTTFSANDGANGSAITCQHEDGALLRLISCKFTSNLGGSAVYKTGLTLRPSIRSSACSFTDNRGSVFVMENGDWQDSTSLFTATKGRAVLISNYATAVLNNTVFTNNVGAISGGGAMASSTATLTCTDCLFQFNSALEKGGALYLEQNSVLHLLRTSLLDNHCDIQGSALYFLECKGNSSIRDSFIKRNSNGKGGDANLFLFSAQLVISNTTVDGNTNSYTTPGILMIMGVLHVLNSTFSNQKGILGPHFLVITFSVLNITQSSLSQSFGNTGGAIAVTSSNVTLVECEFRDISADAGGALSASTQSFIVANKLNVDRVKATNLGGVFSLIESSLDVRESVFMGYDNGCIFGEKVPTLTVEYSVFRDGKSQLGGAVYCSRCLEVSMAHSQFINNSATVGGALYFITPADTNVTTAYLLNSVNIKSNLAQKGGGMFSDNLQILANNMIFEDNRAVQVPDSTSSGQGGAAVLSCTVSEICQFKFSESKFTNNSATLQAGAVMWTDVEPKYESTVFNNNVAYYGADTASYPVTMGAMTPSGALESGGRRLGAPVVSTIYGVASGQDQHVELSLALLDHRGAVVKVDNSSTAFLFAEDGDSTAVSGQTKTTAEMGVFLFSNFRVSAMPNTTVVVLIETSSIDPAKAAKSGSSATYHATVAIEVHMRECVLGETLQGRDCVPCPYGKFTLIPEQACRACPVGGNCFGGALIVPKSGYWRASVYTDLFFQCMRTSSCLGSPDDSDLGVFHYTGECATGYHSNLCQSCDYGYSVSGKNQCGKCPPRDVNRVRIALIMLAMLVFVIFTVRSTMMAVYKPRKVTEVYIKIIVNYLQLITYASNFRLNWPSEIEDLYDSQRGAESVSEQLYSYDCFLQSSKNTAFNEDVYYTKKVLLAAYPAAFSIAAVIVWIILARIKKRPFYLRKHMPATVVILFFIYHPAITQSMFSMFNCLELEPGEYWLSDDMAIRCWNRTHVYYSLVVAVPSLVLWVFLVPIACLLHLIKNRRTLHSDDVLKSRYSFLLKGYNRRHFFWEFVILLRKISVICVLVFMNNIAREIQALTVLMILSIMVYLQYRYNPYFTDTLNLVELMAILVATITIYCGLYFLSDELDNSSTWFFFVVIVLANAVFLVTWAWNTFKAYLKQFSVYIPAIGKIIIPQQFFSDPLVNEYTDKPVGRKTKIASHPIFAKDVHSIFEDVMKNEYEKLKPTQPADSPENGQTEQPTDDLAIPEGDKEPSILDENWAD